MILAFSQPPSHFVGTSAGTAETPQFRRRRCGTPGWSQPKKCHEFETDLGDIAVRQVEKPQVRQDQYVTGGETVNLRSTELGAQCCHFIRPIMS
jgi:hypothetical protein